MTKHTPTRTTSARPPLLRVPLAAALAGALVSALVGALVGSAAGCATLTGGPPTGSEDKPTDEDLGRMKAVGAKVKGTIVWSSSRAGNHDLYTMNTDGSDVHAITKGDTVDWFPRFAPDGARILFCRSKKGWVSERDANNSDKWDLWTVAPDGSGEKKVIENASWGTWIGGNEVIFVRGTKVLRTVLGTDKEVELMDSAGVEALDGALLQQPEMSHDGHYIAITLRGAKRETGIWDIAKKTWRATGLGCQINWTPDGNDIYWVNPTGNGGSEVYRMPIQEGKPPKETPPEDKLRFMDMPGRRSHEYFPELSADGKWMVWGITQRGHDHDIADYEIYIWEVGAPAEQAARLTFHSANDRWPDLFIPAAAAAGAVAAEPGKLGTDSAAKGEAKPEPTKVEAKTETKTEVVTETKTETTTPAAKTKSAAKHHAKPHHGKPHKKAKP